MASNSTLQEAIESYRSGMRSLGNGRPQEAADSLVSAMHKMTLVLDAEDPGFGMVGIDLGAAYLALGELDAARQVLDRSVYYVQRHPDPSGYDEGRLFDLLNELAVATEKKGDGQATDEIRRSATSLASWVGREHLYASNLYDAAVDLTEKISDQCARPTGSGLSRPQFLAILQESIVVALEATLRVAGASLSEAATQDLISILIAASARHFTRSMRLIGPQDRSLTERAEAAFREGMEVYAETHDLQEAIAIFGEQVGEAVSSPEAASTAAQLANPFLERLDAASLIAWVKAKPQ